MNKYDKFYILTVYYVTVSSYCTAAKRKKLGLADFTKRCVLKLMAMCAKFTGIFLHLFGPNTV